MSTKATAANGMVRTSLMDAGCIAIDAQRFGHGMEVMFTGLGEVFRSLGVKEPPMRVVYDDKPGGDKTEPTAPAAPEKVTEASKAEPRETPAPESTPAVDPVETPAPASEPAPAQESTPVPAPEAPLLTYDELTNFIRDAIKAKHGVNEDIKGLLSEKFGVSKVSELPKEQYGAFKADIEALLG